LSDNRSGSGLLEMGATIRIVVGYSGTAGKFRITE
jgi:hypothetical protein